jgi:hypothetical protein
MHLILLRFEGWFTRTGFLCVTPVALRFKLVFDIYDERA